MNPPGLRRARDHRAGFVLATVLLLGVALTLVAHAALLLSSTAVASAVGEAGRVAATGTLDARLSEAFRRIATSGDLGAVAPSGVSSALLTPELVRLRADSGALRREVIVWLPDPQTRLVADSVGVRVGAPPDGLTRSRVVSVPTAADPCPLGVVPAPPLWAADAAVGWGDDDPLRLGPLPRSELGRRLPALPTVPPVPARAGHADGPTRFGPGLWRGWFWVEGDAEILAGARVLGRLAVSGTLVVRGGGEVRGLTAVGGRLTIESGGLLRVAPCTAAVVSTERRWRPVRLRALQLSR